jgi:hypothetical protein
MKETYIDIIVKSSIKRATAFLNDAQEFYPFGSIIDKDGEIIPVGFYDEREFLPSKEIIEILEKELLKSIQIEESKAVAIGVDVFINNNGEKKNALLIKISENGIDWIEKYFIYSIKKNRVIWL